MYIYICIHTHTHTHTHTHIYIYIYIYIYIFNNLTILRNYQPGISDKGVPFPARTKQLFFTAKRPAISTNQFNFQRVKW